MDVGSGEPAQEKNAGLFKPKGRTMGDHFPFFRTYSMRAYNQAPKTEKLIRTTKTYSIISPTSEQRATRIPTSLPTRVSQ